MASVVHDPGGRKRISYQVGAIRRSMRLGAVPLREAQAIADHISRLISCRNAPRLLGDDVIQWVKGLMAAEPRHYDQLAAAGLVPQRVPATALGQFLADALGSLHVKPATLTFYGHTRRCLLMHFGTARDLAAIGPREADGFVTWLAAHFFARAPRPGHEARAPRRLSPATVARRTSCARDLLGIAVRWGLLAKNPFAGIRAGRQTNAARKRYVPAADVEKVIEATADKQFRLVLALSRYGGLRCPSEHQAVTWDDVVWGDEGGEGGSITVRSSKTEHHAGGEARIVPLFAQLRPYLLDAFEAAEPGSVHVVTGWRDPAMNLRTRLKKTIARAGVKPWPKLFNNLRASCETDLARQYPLQTVAAWLGHRPEMMVAHYLSNPDLDQHFREATRNPTRNGAKSGVISETQSRAENAKNPEIPQPGPVSAGGGNGQNWALKDSNYSAVAEGKPGAAGSDAPSDARAVGAREILHIFANLNETRAREWAAVGRRLAEETS